VRAVNEKVEVGKRGGRKRLRENMGILVEAGGVERL
jgi:hypothetical protein